MNLGLGTHVACVWAVLRPGLPEHALEAPERVLWMWGYADRQASHKASPLCFVLLWIAASLGFLHI